MIDKIIEGFGKRQYSIYPASSWAAIDEMELPHYDFDPAKANQLLDAAGYVRGADGIRVSKDGKPLRFRIDYDSGNKVREQMALVVLSYLKEIGIGIDITAYESQCFYGQDAQG